jgi:TatD DNase family protein
LARRPKVVAIGEIGLDFFRNLSSRSAQKIAFEAQLLLAQELDLPVVIHDREAHGDVLESLLKFKGKIKGVMHCFSGNKELAEQCLNLGFLISFAGNVTYPKAVMLQEAAKRVDLEKMLLETDCPFLTPQDMRGKRNEPSYLPITAQKIAQLKEVSLEKVAEVTARNAKEIFKIE